MRKYISHFVAITYFIAVLLLLVFSLVKESPNNSSELILQRYILYFLLLCSFLINIILYNIYTYERIVLPKYSYIVFSMSLLFLLKYELKSLLKDYRNVLFIISTIILISVLFGNTFTGFMVGVILYFINLVLFLLLKNLHSHKQKTLEYLRAFLSIQMVLYPIQHLLTVEGINPIIRFGYLQQICIYFIILFAVILCLSFLSNKKSIKL
jgi:hypothetical protein